MPLSTLAHPYTSVSLTNNLSFTFTYSLHWPHNVEKLSDKLQQVKRYFWNMLNLLLNIYIYILVSNRFWLVMQSVWGIQCFNSLYLN